MMYLDCDTTPPMASRYVPPKTTSGAVKNAICKMEEKQITEGQYENSVGVGFKGYVIKYPGQEPYFEAAPAE